MEAAASLADGEGLQVRGEPYRYGALYPTVAAPVVALAGDREAAYALLKVLNSLLFALTAVPAYLLARRLLEPWPSVAVAALSVAVPSSVYVTVVMTESVAYLTATWALLAIVLAVERPTAWRQLAALVAVGRGGPRKGPVRRAYTPHSCSRSSSRTSCCRSGGGSAGAAGCGMLWPAAASLVLGLVLFVVGPVLRGGSPGDALGWLRAPAAQLRPRDRRKVARSACGRVRAVSRRDPRRGRADRPLCVLRPRAGGIGAVCGVRRDLRDGERGGSRVHCDCGHVAGRPRVRGPPTSRPLLVLRRPAMADRARLVGPCRGAATARRDADRDRPRRPSRAALPLLAARAPGRRQALQRRGHGVPRGARGDRGLGARRGDRHPHRGRAASRRGLPAARGRDEGRVRRARRRLPRERRARLGPRVQPSRGCGVPRLGARPPLGGRAGAGRARPSPCSRASARTRSSSGTVTS